MRTFWYKYSKPQHDKEVHTEMKPLLRNQVYDIFDLCQGGQSDRASALAKRWHFYQICVFRFLFMAHLTHHRLLYLILHRDYEGWQIFSSLSWAGFDWSFPLASLLLNGLFSRPREGYCPANRSIDLTAWLSQWDISGYFCVLYNRTEIWVWKKASAVKKGGN